MGLIGYPREALEVRVRALLAGAELRQEEGQLRRCEAQFEDIVLTGPLCLVQHCRNACCPNLLSGCCQRALDCCAGDSAFG